MKYRFILLADASSDSGAGHMMRCLPIIQKCKDYGFDVVVIANLTFFPWIKRILENKSIQILEKLEYLRISEKSDLLILDSYSLKVDYELIQKDFWKAIILVGDPNTPDYKCDIFINASLSRVPNFQYINSSKIISGRSGVMTREEISNLTPRADLPDDKNLSILITGGATDFGDFGKAIISELKKLNISFHAKVFLRDKTNFDFDSRIEYFSVGPEMTDEISRSTVFLSTAGSSAYDFIIAGGAVGLAAGPPNQFLNYEELITRKLAAGIGRYDIHRGWEIDALSLEKLLTDFEFREQLRFNSKNFFLKNAAEINFLEILKYLNISP